MGDAGRFIAHRHNNRDGHRGWIYYLAVDPAQWPTTTVGDVMRPDAPVGRPDWTIGQALAVMQGAHVDHLPVVGDDGRLQGVATTVDILDLDDLLERLESRP